MATKTAKPKASAPKETVSSVNAKIKAGVVERFLSALEGGAGIWNKGHDGQPPARPTNMLTGAPYSGMNVLILGLMSGFRSSRWITYKQLDTMRKQLAADGMAEDQLPFVRPGSKSTVAVFVKKFEYEKKSVDESGEGTSETKASFPYSQFNLFNEEQIENCPSPAPSGARSFDEEGQAELMLAALQVKTGLAIHHGQGNYYSPAHDSIHLYPKELFHDSYQYYSTAAHEAIHCTLSPKRMARTEALATRWGDQAYSMEELRAEIGSLLLSMELGLAPTDEHIRNHAAYVQSWRKNLSGDPSELFRAMSDATKCVEYLLDLTRAYTIEKAAELADAPASAAAAARPVPAPRPTPEMSL